MAANVLGLPLRTHRAERVPGDRAGIPLVAALAARSGGMGGVVLGDLDLLEEDRAEPFDRADRGLVARIRSEDDAIVMPCHEGRERATGQVGVPRASVRRMNREADVTGYQPHVTGRT